MDKPAPAITEVRVDWDTARAANRANWDERARLHAASYRLDQFDDPGYISPVIREDAERLAKHLPGETFVGQRIAHLQCHIGSDTVSLSRLGATVTGLDFSAEAIGVARDLAARTRARATFVEADVMDAAEALGPAGPFDVVYTSVGTICWLVDLTTWAAQIAELLAPDGVFYFRDTHPILECIDETRDELVLRYPYFPRGRALRVDEETSYTGDVLTDQRTSYCYVHPVSEIVTSLLSANLQIVAMAETASLDWPFVPRMIKDGEGRFALPEPERHNVPCNLVLVARPTTAAGR